MQFNPRITVENSRLLLEKIKDSPRVENPLSEEEEYILDYYLDTMNPWDSSEANDDINHQLWLNFSHGWVPSNNFEWSKFIKNVLLHVTYFQNEALIAKATEKLKALLESHVKSLAGDPLTADLAVRRFSLDSFILPNPLQTATKIGEGSFGTVYKIFPTGDPNSVPLAIKIAKTKKNRPVIRDLIAEALILKKLASPHVIPIIGLYIEKDAIGMATKFANKGALTDVIQTDFLSSEIKADLAFKIASALAYILSQHFYHCDFNPNNILVEQDPGTGHLQVRLSDFGAAYEEYPEHIRTIEEAVTTYAYCAPEHLAADLETRKLLLERKEGPHRAIISSEVTEVFCLGQTLYHLYAGRFPSSAVAFSKSELKHTDPYIQNKQVIEDMVTHAASYQSNQQHRMSLVASPIPALAEAINACCASDPSARASISKVVSLLAKKTTPVSPPGTPLKKRHWEDPTLRAIPDAPEPPAKVARSSTTPT